MRTRILFCILAAWLVGGATSSIAQSDADRRTPAVIRAEDAVIRAEDIGETAKVVGRTGYPLHEAATLSGVWVEIEPPPQKPDTRLRFRVDQINGKRLDRPVDFHPNDVTVYEKLEVEATPARGERWELRAYETWPRHYPPYEYLKELGVQPYAAPQHGATRMFGVLKKRSAR